MFVYLIIAIELAILYVVFWIVFLREPKPREVKAELWGSYFKSANQQPQSAIQPKRGKKIIARRSRQSRLHYRLYSRTVPGHYAHQKTHLAQQASRTVVEKFLLSLNRVLNRLSVKVP